MTERDRGRRRENWKGGDGSGWVEEGRVWRRRAAALENEECMVCDRVATECSQWQRRNRRRCLWRQGRRRRRRESPELGPRPRRTPSTGDGRACGGGASSRSSGSTRAVRHRPAAAGPEVSAAKGAQEPTPGWADTAVAANVFQSKHVPQLWAQIVSLSSVLSCCAGVRDTYLLLQ